jgi:hypothetical protein
MKNWHSQLDMSEVSHTFLHVLTASGTLKGAISCAKSRVIETAFTWALLLLILKEVCQKCSVVETYAKKRY